MVPTKLLVGQSGGFVVVIAGNWCASPSKHRRKSEKKQSQKSGIALIAHRAYTCVRKEHCEKRSSRGTDEPGDYSALS